MTASAVEYTVRRRRIPWYPAENHPLGVLPLGRNLNHDSRSWAYLVPDATPAAVVSRSWPRHAPILNQGEVGSCTGNAAVGAISTDPLYGALPTPRPPLNEPAALTLYSAAEDIDGDGPYPPNDNGSSGLSVAKAAQKAGLIGGYRHCMALSTMQAALQKGPVIVGVSWYDSFDTPDSNGLITISRGASVRGGHEFEVYGLDMANGLFWADNSWGSGWGVTGRFCFSFDTMGRLLDEDGDCTAFEPLTTPAPTPTPTPAPESVDQALWDVVGPWAAEDRTRPDLVTVQGALNTWGTAKGFR